MIKEMAEGLKQKYRKAKYEKVYGKGAYVCARVSG